jgi:hypothetical protein
MNDWAYIENLCHFTSLDFNDSWSSSFWCCISYSDIVEMLYKRCFPKCQSPTSVTIESDSRMQRIDESAFSESGSTTRHSPASVEMLCNRCFYTCDLLRSVTFELLSKLRKVPSDSFERLMCQCQIVNEKWSSQNKDHLCPILLCGKVNSRNICQSQIFPHWVIDDNTLDKAASFRDSSTVDAPQSLTVRQLWQFCFSACSLIFKPCSVLNHAEASPHSWNARIILDASTNNMFWWKRFVITFNNFSHV